jgi:hypothetical protein
MREACGFQRGIGSPIERTLSSHASLSRLAMDNAIDFTSPSGTHENDDEQLQGWVALYLHPAEPSQVPQTPCCQKDLQRMLSPEVPGNEEVSLGILSQPHLDLLEECALRWRMGHAYRAMCFLDLVQEFSSRKVYRSMCPRSAERSV